MTRKYIPEVGTMVKLRLFEHYTRLQLASSTAEPHVWARFKALSVDRERSTIELQLCNGTTPCPQTYTVSLSMLQMPIGWQPVYTIYCASLEQAEKVRDSWFTRGIHVWVSHDLSSVGGMAFTPFSEGEPEATQSPHWQYTGNPCDSVPPGQCPMVFNIVHIEQWEPQLPTNPKAKRAELARLRAELGVTVEYQRRGMRWSAERETAVYIAKPWEPQEE